jgi:hypothetical protein
MPPGPYVPALHVASVVVSHAPATGGPLGQLVQSVALPPEQVTHEGSHAVQTVSLVAVHGALRNVLLPHDEHGRQVV